MFSDSIDSKINKIKVNFDNYLNDKKKEPSPQPPLPSVRRPELLSSAGLPTPSLTLLAPVSSLLAPSPAPPKSLQLDIKQLVVQGKSHERQPLSLKNIQKEKTINIFYIEEQTRFKLEIRVIDNSLQLKINQDKATIDIAFKRASRYKFVKPETGEPKWLITSNDLKDEKVTLVCSKQAKSLKSYFEGIVPEENIKSDPTPGENKLEEKLSVVAEGAEKEEQHDQDIINFLLPSSQQLADTEKFRRALKDMKEEEKNMILMDIYKIKKEYEDPTQLDRKKLMCPIFACKKIYREISQLKTHLKKHPELNKHGIELTDYGTFEFGSKAMDLALLLGKMYPFEMKKIVKKMKTRQVLTE